MYIGRAVQVLAPPLRRRAVGNYRAGPDLRGARGAGPRPPTHRGPPTKLAGLHALFCYLLVLHF